MLADIAEAGRAEQRVDQRVGEHVGIGVAVQPDALRRSRRRRARACGPAAKRWESIADPDERHRPSPARRGRAESGSTPPRVRRSNTHSSPTPSALEQLERAVVVGADVLGPVGVAGERDGHAGLEAHLEERRRGVDLAGALAQPGGRDLDRDARLGDPGDRELVVAAQVAARAGGPARAPDLDEVGVGEDVEQAAARGLADRLEVARARSPRGLGAASHTL